MTAKHVVADDLYGKFSKRIWELDRRVLEGTIPIEDALDVVQRIFDGTFPKSLPPVPLPELISTALAEIVEEKKRGYFFPDERFHHAEIGRRLFFRRHCGTRALQVRFYHLWTYDHGIKQVRRSYDDMALCPVCGFFWDVQPTAHND